MQLYIMQCWGLSLPMFPALITLPLLSPVTRLVLRRVVTSSLAEDLVPELRLVRPGLAATQASLSGHS